MIKYLKYCLEAISNYGVYKNKLMFISGYTNNSTDNKLKRIHEVIIFKSKELE